MKRVSVAFIHLKLHVKNQFVKRYQVQLSIGLQAAVDSL